MFPAISLLAGGVVACEPALTPPGASCEQPNTSDGAVEVALEPAAPLDAAPSVLRLRLRADAPIATEQLAFVSGELGPSHLGQLARDDVSGALSQRMLPALSWSEEDGSVVLAPTVALEPNLGYALGSGQPRFATGITTIGDDPLPLLRLRWPPHGAAANAHAGVWCGDDPLEPRMVNIRLDPGAVEAELRPGAIHAIGRRCVHLAPLQSTDEALLAPPALKSDDDTPWARLEPIPLTRDAEAVPVVPLVCASGEQSFGPGCLRVEDDRAWLTTPEAPLLWAIDDGTRDTVFTSSGEVLLLAPLSPASTITLTLETLDLQGNATTSAVRVDTLAAMPHVVINEVLANPVGEEPEQEWVELYNDGLAPAQLDGYLLTDVGGEVWLPPVELGPGAYAVVVNADFDPNADYDPPPAPSATLVVVDKLGKNGLSNAGEPLKLLDANDRVVSRFPASPKPKSGRSVMRTAPKARDDDPAGFVLSDEGASTPGSG